MPKPKTRYLKIKEAAILLKVSSSTLRAWDKNGKLRASRRGRSKYRLYSVSDLQKFRENNRFRGYYNKSKRG
ncbi:MAG: MerR family DNA-binding transcriptional regulator [bacterium]|nr:MerR family DNA-binding transcriptional regulator [bacterium]